MQKAVVDQAYSGLISFFNGDYVVRKVLGAGTSVTNGSYYSIYSLYPILESIFFQAFLNGIFRQTNSIEPIFDVSGPAEAEIAEFSRGISFL